jgi:Flp pilus assembly pilin Flp
MEPDDARAAGSKSAPSAPDRLATGQRGVTSIEYLLIGAMILAAVASVMSVMMISLRNAYLFLVDFFCSPVL